MGDRQTIIKPVISFSFDDGRLDNYTVAYPIMKKYRIPATFNITTGYIEGRFQEGQLTHGKPMNIQMVNDLYNEPDFEIACHGYWHLNTIDDILKGEKCLCNDLGIPRLYNGSPIGFASPGTSLDLHDYNLIKEELQNHNIVYVRLAQRYKSMKIVKVFMRKMARLFHFPILYRLSYQDSLHDNVENDLLYSIPIMASTTISEIKGLINMAIKKNKSCILMWHSIVPEEDIKDNFDYSKDKFEKLCYWLKRKQDEGILSLSKTIDLYMNLKQQD